MNQLQMRPQQGNDSLNFKGPNIPKNIIINNNIKVPRKNNQQDIDSDDISVSQNSNFLSQPQNDDRIGIVKCSQTLSKMCSDYCISKNSPTFSCYNKSKITYTNRQGKQIAQVKKNVCICDSQKSLYNINMDNKITEINSKNDIPSFVKENELNIIINNSNPYDNLFKTVPPQRIGIGSNFHDSTSDGFGGDFDGYRVVADRKLRKKRNTEKIGKGSSKK